MQSVGATLSRSELSSSRSSSLRDSFRILRVPARIRGSPTTYPLLFIASLVSGQAKAKGGAYGWSRDKDLDAGRRVDKNNLNNLMAGKKALEDKFAGSVMKF